MKTSSNGNRLNDAIPIGIDEKSLVATVLEMGERFDAFIGNELVFGKTLGDFVRILSGNASSAAHALNLENADKQKKAAEDQHFQELIRQLQQEIAWHKQQIEDNNQQIDKLEAQATIIAGMIEHLENGGRFALNADGSLQDAEKEAIIKAYEDKYGVTVDRNDPERLREVLGNIRDRIETLITENQFHRSRIEKVQDIQNHLENPATRDVGEQMAKDLLKDQTENGKRTLDDLIGSQSNEKSREFIELRPFSDKGDSFAKSSLDADSFWDNTETMSNMQSEFKTAVDGIELQNIEATSKIDVAVNNGLGMRRQF